MAEIRFKKPIYPVSNSLRNYLRVTNREIDVPISYQDLTHANSTIASSIRRVKTHYGRP
jgi:hypothetical protein